MDLHRLGEERSIALHRAVAERMRQDDGVLAAARERVASWLADGTVHSEYARAWAAVLAGTVETVAAALVDPGEKMRALRQCSPFAGALDARTRWRIRREVASASGE